MKSKPRFPISQEEVGIFVERLYMRISEDPVLAPIYSRHIESWPKHIERLTAFWENVVFGNGSDSASPLIKHLRTGEIRPEHFERWLGVFRKAAEDSLSPIAASAWELLAERLSTAYERSAQHNMSAMAFGHREDLENSPDTERPTTPETDGRDPT